MRDFIEEDRIESQKFADVFIEEVNADDNDVIRMSRDAGCRIRDHIENLRRKLAAAPALPAVEDGIGKFFGIWPGDETDEQLLAAIDEIRKPPDDKEDRVVELEVQLSAAAETIRQMTARESPEFDESVAEEIWERHCELMEVIECDSINHLNVMRQKDFYKAVADVLRRMLPYSAPKGESE